MSNDISISSIPQSIASSPVFDALQPLSAFQVANAHVFPSVSSLRWFYSQHRKELIAAGAVVEFAGRLMINPSVFVQKALIIGQSAAAARSKNAVNAQ